MSGIPGKPELSTPVNRMCRRPQAERTAPATIAHRRRKQVLVAHGQPTDMKRSISHIDEDDYVDGVVYGAQHKPTKSWIYVGSTEKGTLRSIQHMNLDGHTARFKWLLANPCMRPSAEFIEFVVLWSGRIPRRLLRAMEQLKMDEKQTRIKERPVSGGIKDYDVKQWTTPLESPPPCNSINACNDAGLLKEARALCRDSTSLMVLSESDKQVTDLMFGLLVANLNQVFEMSALHAATSASRKYTTVDAASSVSSKEVQSDLNAVMSALHDDDGPDARIFIQSQLRIYNQDHNPDKTWEAAVVSRMFAATSVMLGHVPMTPAVTTKGCASSSLKPAKKLSKHECFDLVVGLFPDVVLVQDSCQETVTFDQIADALMARCDVLTWEKAGGPVCLTYDFQKSKFAKSLAASLRQKYGLRTTITGDWLYLRIAPKPASRPSEFVPVSEVREKEFKDQFPSKF